MDYTGPVDGRVLLHGCFQEADRSRVVAMNLEGLRAALAESYHAQITALIEEIRTTSNILRQLFERAGAFFNRVPVVLDYLNIVLPCLSRTLRDITTFYEDRALAKDLRWRKMYHKMMAEAGNMPLLHRFSLYNHFLTVLVQLLVRYGAGCSMSRSAGLIVA
jgi:hypothetical protein